MNFALYNLQPVAVKDNTLPVCHVCSDEEKQDKQKSRRKNSKTDEELIQCSECKKSGRCRVSDKRK